MILNFWNPSTFAHVTADINLAYLQSQFWISALSYHLISEEKSAAISKLEFFGTVRCCSCIALAFDGFRSFSFQQAHYWLFITLGLLVHHDLATEKETNQKDTKTESKVLNVYFLISPICQVCGIIVAFMWIGLDRI